MGKGSNFTATKEGVYNVVIIKNTPDIGNDCVGMQIKTRSIS